MLPKAKRASTWLLMRCWANRVVDRVIFEVSVKLFVFSETSTFSRPKRIPVSGVMDLRRVNAGSEASEVD